MTVTRTIDGNVMFAEFEVLDMFEWTDPTTNKVKELRSLKVLFSHGDKTTTRESISLPENFSLPKLVAEQKYGFPVKIKLNKKKQRIDYELRKDMAPFPAPEIQ